MAQDVRDLVVAQGGDLLGGVLELLHRGDTSWTVSLESANYATGCTKPSAECAAHDATCGCVERQTTHGEVVSQAQLEVDALLNAGKNGL